MSTDTRKWFKEAGYGASEGVSGGGGRSRIWNDDSLGLVFTSGRRVERTEMWKLR